MIKGDDVTTKTSKEVLDTQLLVVCPLCGKNFGCPAFLGENLDLQVLAHMVTVCECGLAYPQNKKVIALQLSATKTNKVRL